MTGGPAIKAQTIVSAPFLLCCCEGAPLACSGQIHRAWLGPCTSADVGAVGDVRLSPLVLLVIPVDSNLVVQLDAYLDKFVEHIWEVVIVREGRLQLWIKSFPEERNFSPLV